MNLISYIENSLTTQGLSYLGVVGARPSSIDFERYQEWLRRGSHGSMDYLMSRLKERSDPDAILPGAQSVITFYMAFPRNGATQPRIAAYAHGKDYHHLVRERAESAIEGFKEVLPKGTEYRAVVDSAPVLERALAAGAGRGFIGKNTCFITPRDGSFLVLGEIFLTAPLSSDGETPPRPDERTAAGGCGTCKRCQVHCPTGALAEDYTIDARRCISYWTIEHRGTIPEEFWAPMGRYWYGCDICQDVCPYNRGVEENPRPKNFDLWDVATMDQKNYEALFGGTAMTRAKRHGLQRNALIAMHVTGDKRISRALELSLSSDHETVRATAQQILAAIARHPTPTLS